MLFRDSNDLATFRIGCFLAHQAVAIATILDYDTIEFRPIDFRLINRCQSLRFLAAGTMTSTLMWRFIDGIGERSIGNCLFGRLRGFNRCIESPLCGLWYPVGGHRSKTTETDKLARMLPFGLIFERLGEDIGRLLLCIAIYKSEPVSA